MCLFLDRVHRCGHYDRTLSEKCDTARKCKSLCTDGQGVTNVSVTTNRKWCEIDGCTKRPANKWEGPSNYCVERIRHTDFSGNRMDGGFDEADVVWTDNEEDDENKEEDDEDNEEDDEDNEEEDEDNKDDDDDE